MQVSQRFAAESAVFDEDSLVSCAGLVPVMRLAEQTGLAWLLAEKVCIAVPRIKSGSANPAPKLATLIAGMCAGADSIDDVDVLRSGGMKTLFGGVYAPDHNADRSCTCPPHWPWPWSKAWLTLWHNTIGYRPPLPAAA